MRILTIGSFDILHHGHLRLFERCAQLGELHVGVNSDLFIRSYKTVEPAQEQSERMSAVLAIDLGLTPSDSLWVRAPFVYLNDGPGRELIDQIAPDLLAVGSDWLDNDYLGQIGYDYESWDATGIGLVFFPRTPGVSSTQIREQRAGEAAL